jgi:hypothetical protein
MLYVFATVNSGTAGTCLLNSISISLLVHETPFAELNSASPRQVHPTGVHTPLVPRPAHFAPGTAVTATRNLAASLATQPGDAVATELAGGASH